MCLFFFLNSLDLAFEKKNKRLRFAFQKKVVFLQRVSLVRSAPFQLPQDRNVARVHWL